MDAKGRVSIPAGFRRVIETGDPDWREGLRPRLVIVYGNPAVSYLECFTMTSIEEVERQIQAMPRGSIERRRLERVIHGRSIEIEIDPDGRLVLPPKARERVEMSDTALFMGAGDTFQIWNPETYAAQEAAEDLEWMEQDGAIVDPFTYLPGRGP